MSRSWQRSKGVEQNPLLASPLIEPCPRVRERLDGLVYGVRYQEATVATILGIPSKRLRQIDNLTGAGVHHDAALTRCAATPNNHRPCARKVWPSRSGGPDDGSELACA